MEKFKCECGFIIDVEFSEKETERNIPCGLCYYEEWEDKILSSVFDSSKGVDVVNSREQIKHTYGKIINCVKGKGI